MLAADDLRKAMRRAFHLGQTYWMHADSESFIQHQKAERVQARFDELMEETVAAAAGVAPSQPLQHEPIPDRVYWAPLADNFYDADGKGQGSEFYRKWKPRCAEFPQGESFGWGKGSAHNPFKDAPRTDGVQVLGEAQERAAWRAWGAGELEYASWLPILPTGAKASQTPSWSPHDKFWTEQPAAGVKGGHGETFCDPSPMGTVEGKR